MNPLVALPRNAQITIDGLVVNIKNCKAVPDTNAQHTFFNILLYAKYHGRWNDVLSQMTSQGFRVEAVADECIAAIKNHKEFTWLLYWFGGSDFAHAQRMIFASTGHAKQIQREIIIKLESCRRWRDLYDMVNEKSEFRKKILKKMQEEMIQYINT